MGALLAGKPRFAALRKTLREMGRLPGKRDRFSPNELKPVAAQRATRPIPPEERRGRRQQWWQRRRGQSRIRKRINGQRPEHGTDTARFLGGGMFLTLLSQGAGPTIPNATSIQDAQRAIVFGSALLCVERAVSGAAQGTVGLQGKSGARKPSSKGAFGPLRRA